MRKHASRTITFFRLNRSNLRTRAMGRTIYQLICRGRTFVNPVEEWFYVDVRSDAEPILTTGRHLLNAPYSRSLRCVIFQCLAYDYTLRTTARELMKYVEEGIEASRAVEAEIGLGIGFEEGFMMYDEPGDLDPGWFGAVKVPIHAAAPAQTAIPVQTPTLAPPTKITRVTQAVGNIDLNAEAPRSGTVTVLQWLK